MRTLSLCLLSLLLWGCRQNVAQDEIPVITKGKYFFDFDEVVYYKTELAIDQLVELYDKKHKTKQEIQLLDLVAHEPLTDTLLLINADKAGFMKKVIPNKKYPVIKEIFRENFGDYTVTTSTAVFGDIYVFKRKGKIIGTAKLCYECGKALFTGTEAETEQFGRIGDDFKKLKELVK